MFLGFPFFPSGLLELGPVGALTRFGVLCFVEFFWRAVVFLLVLLFSSASVWAVFFPFAVWAFVLRVDFFLLRCSGGFGGLVSSKCVVVFLGLWILAETAFFVVSFCVSFSVVLQV